MTPPLHPCSPLWGALPSRVALVLSVAALIQVVRIEVARACTCSGGFPWDSPAVLLEAHALVFAGTVVEVHGQGCGDHERVLTLSVDEGFQGVVAGDTVDVGHTTTTTSCSIGSFSVGDRVLVFGDEEDPGLSLCSPFLRLGTGATLACCVNAEDGPEGSEQMTCPDGMVWAQLPEEQVLAELRDASQD